MAECEEDLYCVLAALSCVFDPNSCLHVHNFCREWSRVEDPAAAPKVVWADAGQLLKYMGRRKDYPDDSASSGSLWLVQLVNIFGEHEGFSLIAQVCCQSPNPPVLLRPAQFQSN